MLAFAAIVTILSTIVSTVFYFKWSHSYWRKKKLPHINGSMPWGISDNLLNPKLFFAETLKVFYEQFKSKGYIHGGFYIATKPAYLPIDLTLIKRILIKDFQYFLSHGGHVDEKNDPLSANLFNLHGEKWRNMRVNLTPTFTSGKLRNLFGTMLTCAQTMTNHVNSLCNDNEQKALELYDISTSFIIDVICSCGFAIESNYFENLNAEFRDFGSRLFVLTFTQRFQDFLNTLKPGLGNKKKYLGFRDTLTDPFVNAIREIVNLRIENGYKRNDYLNILLKMKQKHKENEDGNYLTINQIASQSFIFFFAGFVTSSTTIAFCLHELAYNQDIQRKLRDEIMNVMDSSDGELTYEGVMRMEYLDKVLKETLRKYPAMASLSRVCNKDYLIEETGITIEKGTPVFISVLGIHRDPEYYPNPDIFDPERFSDENKTKRPSFAYMPFGEGPRMCIGMRFALMQIKVGLCLLLKNFSFTPHESMQYCMEFHTTSAVLRWKKALFMNAQKIPQ